MRTYLNDGWYFRRADGDIFADVSSAEEVRIPHANVQTPFNCFDESVFQFQSVYTRVLHFDSLSGNYILTFEGVAHRAEVYVNKQLLATHENGYTAFSVNITSALNIGDNQIAVKVDSRDTVNQPPFGFVIDYLTYGGIYRDVYLDHYVGAYVSDVFVEAQPNSPLKIHVEFGAVSENMHLVAEILDDEVLRFSEYDPKGSQFVFCENVELQLWDIDNPKLYTLRLTVDGNVRETKFGVRSAKFTPEGFFLNGKRVEIVGLNRHQSYPYVGYAMPESMQRRDAQILKNNLCVNLVRTSHYPQSQYFLDECDKLGLLVFTEIPGWQHIGDEKWQSIAVENVREMIVQNRNHPSVVLWGVRINESQDCDALYEKTNALAHSLDPTRQTGGVRYLKKSHLLEDVYTFNDFNRNGATDRNLICEKSAPYLVTEYNGHMFPTKSFDDFPHKRAHMLRYAKMLDDVFASSTTCGAIGWCMFDYNTRKDFGSGDRICYHGVLDMFRNPKIAAGVFSSQGKEPFLELAFTADIGDYPEGNIGERYCLTNADYIDVFKGDAFIRRFTHADSPFKHLPNPPILIDDLIGERLETEDKIPPKYAKLMKEVLREIWDASAITDLPIKTKTKIARIMRGTKLTIEQLISLHNKYANDWGSASTPFTVKAYKNGELVAQKTVGCSKSVRLKIDVSATTLHENTSYDVAAVNIVALDQNDNPLPFISKAVHFKTSGSIELIGPDCISLNGGMGGTFVKTVGKLGEGTLWVDDIPVRFSVK